MAPRRYGKTSLINQTLQDCRLAHCIIELTLASNSEDIEQLILKNIADLLYSILPRAQKAKQAIMSLFSWLNPELVLNAAGQKLVFHPERKSTDSVTTIAEILKRIDQTAINLNQRIVIVIDEFQQISEIKESTIEATIRHAMQYSQKTTYVFSGSNRHLLHNMFNDKNRPFYNSCD